MITEKKKAIWVAALRSGKYKQGHNVLEHNGTYCCLGVYCKLFNIISDSPTFIEIFKANGVIEINKITQEKLAELNDKKNISFNGIADVIERMSIEEMTK